MLQIQLKIATFVPIIALTMESFSLRGLGIALITPFRADKSVDFPALERLVNRAIEANIDYIVVLGTTAENATLTHDERRDVALCIARTAAGRLPLVLGLGGNCTAGVLEEFEHTDLSPFAAILSVVPFYNKPSQEGMYQHYKAIAQASPVPVILYNVPGRTGVNMTAATTLRIARDCPNVIGIKEASGNMTQVEEIIKNKPEGFEVVSGDDALAYPFICMGAQGVISVMGNAYPRSFGALIHASLNQELDKAKQLQHEFDRMYHLLFCDGNPAGVKAVLHAQGLIENELRLPLTPVSAETQALILNTMKELADD